jgi:hypothetical protein
MPAAIPTWWRSAAMAAAEDQWLELEMLRAEIEGG